MRDVRKTLKALAILYLLLAVDSVLVTDILLPDVFPVRNPCTLYLLVLSVWLILRYSRRVAERHRVKTMMLWLSHMILLLILLRGIRYSVFGGESVPSRYTWYLYYVPMLLIPMFLFYVACYVDAKEEQLVRKHWGWVAAVTAVMILLVLTNNLHQQVFRFQPGFADWYDDYSYGPGYMVVTAWEYLLYAVAVGALVVKCSLSGARKWSWLILIPFAVGLTLILLQITGRTPRLNGSEITRFPEIYCSMAAGAVECCMQLGMLPASENYRALMEITSVPVQITDTAGRIVYQSDAAGALTEQQLSAPDNTRIGVHTILRRMAIHGGFGFWQKNVTELDRINEELEDVNDRLSEESELIRLQNELQEKQARIEQRTKVYDEIAQATQHQSMAISLLAQQAQNTENAAEKDRYRRQIALLGAYIKRYANLTLLASADQNLSVGELGLSVAELLRYLNLYGIPGTLINTASGTVSAQQALTVFEAFETLLEEQLRELTGVFVNLSMQDGSPVFKLMLENMLHGFPEILRAKLEAAGIGVSVELEDDAGYLCLAFSEKGGAV